MGIEHRNGLLITILWVASALVAGACGGSGTDQADGRLTGAGVSEPSGSTMPMDANTDHHRGADHTLVRDIPDGVAVPTLALDVTKDPLEGWNVNLAVTDFRFAPEKVSTVPTPGEGHAHVYVDGQKVGRVYGSWFHVSGLALGEHHLTVELSDNDHAALAMSGDIIDASARLVVEDEPNGVWAVGEVAASEPYPSVDMQVVDDPAGGHNLRVEFSNFRLAPEKVSTTHTPGEGYVRLYIDGESVARVYEPWHQLPALADGDHEIRLELRSHDHRRILVAGEPVGVTTQLRVDTDAAPSGEGTHHDHGGSGSGVARLTPAELESADQVIVVEVREGRPVGGPRRVSVPVGSSVALRVSADVEEMVHVHGYDIVGLVTATRPAHFGFVADIPGIFEVELENAGRLLAQLEVS